MAVFPAGQQVILLCDSWYPKGDVLSLVDEFPQLEIICNACRDTTLYDFPPPREGNGVALATVGNGCIFILSN